jgi:hypothetical protein
MLLSIPAIALADTLTVSNSVSVDQNATKNPGDTGTANVWLDPTNGTPTGDTNGCNASTAAGQAVTVALSSNNTAVTFPNGNTAQITACGSANAKQITYKVASNASAGSATISANATGGKSGQTNNYLTTDTLTVTINAPADSAAPTLHLPGNITEEASGPNGNVVTFTATADDANPAHPAVTCSPNSGSTFVIGTTTVNCSATDAANNTATGSFTVKVQDTTAPAISDMPSDKIVEATSANGAQASWTAPTASDAVDGSVNVNCSPNSGSTFALGTTEVTCTATDAAGNSSSAKFNVTVEDTTAPAIAAHADVTAEATGPDGANVSYTSPGTTDAVDGDGTATCTPTSGSKFDLGETTVNCTATDGHNNTATSTFKVTVADTTAPVIAAHADVNATATSANGALVTYTSPGTTDAVDGPGTATCTPASGTTFAVGSTTVTCTATDGHNNTATSTFKVNVAYSWSNFLQPINVTGTQSVFKLGSTVPVKFNLTGASSGITDGTFYLKYFYLGAGDGLGEQEAVATTTGTTGTEFRYSAGQYIYNWNTKSVSKPGNYELRVYSDSAGTVLLGKVAIEIKK